MAGRSRQLAMSALVVHAAAAGFVPPIDGTASSLSMLSTAALASRAAVPPHSNLVLAAGGWRARIALRARRDTDRVGAMMASDATPDSLPAVIGHRGAKGSAPENTMASIRAAKALDCKWVEVDVMLTKDKVPVIHHDNTLDRCTNGSGNLWEYSLKDVEKLGMGFMDNYVM